MIKWACKRFPDIDSTKPVSRLTGKAIERAERTKKSEAKVSTSTHKSAEFISSSDDEDDLPSAEDVGGESEEEDAMEE